MTIYYDYAAGRGNFDDGYEPNDYDKVIEYKSKMQYTPQKNQKIKISEQKTTPIEWKPTFLPKSKESPNSSPQRQSPETKTISKGSNISSILPKPAQSKTPKQKNTPNSRKTPNQSNKFRYSVKDDKQSTPTLSIGSKYVKPTKTEEDQLHPSISLPSEITRFNLFTQEMIDFAPSSRVFFNPVRIQGESSLIIAVKHEKYLKKKNFNKSFNSFSSQSLLSPKMITSSSVFELRPYNDVSIKSL